MPEGHLACVSSMLPLLATHLLKYARWSRPDPLALPAAGFPGSRGGNCLAVSALHFLATSAVIAEADPGSEPSARHVSASSAHPDLKCLNMTLLSLAARDGAPPPRSAADVPVTPVNMLKFGRAKRPCSGPQPGLVSVHANRNTANPMSSQDLIPGEQKQPNPASN